MVQPGLQLKGWEPGVGCGVGWGGVGGWGWGWRDVQFVPMPRRCQNVMSPRSETCARGGRARCVPCAEQSRVAAARMMNDVRMLMVLWWWLGCLVMKNDHHRHLVLGICPPGQLASCPKISGHDATARAEVLSVWARTQDGTLCSFVATTNLSYHWLPGHRYDSGGWGMQHPLTLHPDSPDDLLRRSFWSK